MRKTIYNDDSMKLLVDTNGLKDMLSSGRETAVKIGTKANARMQIGKRVLWNVEKIKLFINSNPEDL
ncbi:hypothetical protein [Butyrivibrio sp. YAB3001]|uniref:hypothetical protein n=1 Tax=Butyrivibrio sp. YAB3001 TaxID=1520812 RepID=UPI0008F63DAB|nr:hypothetical protein [Butyrivibrio sp. YAB3001]SFB86954.1 hypothetical protein SAMN02910398_00937 [Butyrivibrio sp. YAB3001]